MRELFQDMKSWSNKMLSYFPDTKDLNLGCNEEIVDNSLMKMTNLTTLNLISNTKIAR